jgi:peptide deformylase
MASTRRGTGAQVLPIRQHGDPVLRTPTDPVRTFDQELTHLVEIMFASMYAARGVGLAANQIGVGRSIFVMDCEGVVAVVANPTVVALGEEIQEGGEGCLSVAAAARHYPTPRAATASVEGQDEHGRPVRIDGEGEVARCLQHETDHLLGRLFVDRLRGETRRRARAELELLR